MTNRKKDNDDIEEVANNLVNTKLFNIFPSNELKLIKTESGRREIGIDFFYQVFKKDTDEQVLFFATQNKGTDKPIKSITQKNHSERGKIGFSLELKHVKQYYYELREPLLFILCDINNDVTYWYSIQLDTTLPDRIAKKEQQLLESKSTFRKPKLQIYVPSENILNNNNFKNFINDIEWSREEQARKHRYNISNISDYSKIEEEIKGKHIIDQVFTALNFFEGISVLPSRIIIQLPFIKGSRYAYISDFSLKSDNEELYDLISKISLKNETLIYQDGDNCVENQQEKLKKIIDFFKVNLITHLHWSGKKFKSRICIHDLFVYGQCDCARCNFDKLNIDKANRIVKKSLGKKENNLLEKLRSAYASYLLGDLKSSVDLSNQIHSSANKATNPILFTISKYNLIQLKRIIKSNYFQEDKRELLNSINVNTLENDDVFIKRTAPHFIDVFNWIKDYKFYNNTNDLVDDILKEAKRVHFYDKHGSVYSHGKIDELLASFLRFYSFLEYNFIIYDYYYEYEKITSKMLEGLFAYHSIVNPHSSSYDNIGETIFQIWLFYVPMDKVKNLLHQYDIVKLKTNQADSFILSLHEYYDNLISSVEILKKERPLSYFKKKIERVLANTLLIISRLDTNKTETNLIIKKALKFISLVKKKDNRSYVPFNGFSQLLNYRNDISKQNLKKILGLFIEQKNYGSSAFSLAIKQYVETATQKETKKFILEYLEIDSIEHITFDDIDNKFNQLGYAISFLDSEDKLKINELITNELQIKFDASLYHIATIFELIEFDYEMFIKFTNTVPDQSKDDYAGGIFNIYDNTTLSQVVNIAFKNDVHFTDELKSLTERCTEGQKLYYQWLMNLDNFDYSQFNSMWVLEHRTKFFIEKLKKSVRLREELKKSLNHKYIEGVAQFYIKHFT